ncbi:hypothetical protein [Fictibacillus barbaricus]|uniref:Uncharacterized protein n=1 Tax=Fictibacillus barbaricus TaxID=182136 RepID=A0ABS2Z7D7_9BACL|nr:hypothetical protein [Fictibacillus barbaricus]MBN3543918.1 hypothetical protein [Fictibacillus barbaricus]GGB71727.1 hypothetical protein GCM10007199_42410 [Fictibacillus barbaricus]
MQLKKSVQDKIKHIDNGKYIVEIKELFKFFDDNFIKKLTPHERPGNMIGQNCIVLLQTNLFRIKLLCKGYLEGLNKNIPVLSTLSLRALYETTGSLAFLHKKYNQYKNGTLPHDQFDDSLRRLYLGIKDKRGVPEAPDPINVMSLIDAVDYYLKSKYNVREGEFRASYDDLSERCHPNSFSYFLGHKIGENYVVKFSDDNLIHEVEEYNLEYFSITARLYKEIYGELRRQIEEHEEIPYKELHHFKNYTWESGPNKSPNV